MKRTSLLLGAVLGLTAVGAMAQESRTESRTESRAETALDKAKAAVTPGEVVLSGTDMKTLHEGDEARSLRVCVKSDTDAAPIKIQNDAKSMTLKPGECQRVTGMKIAASPEKPLKEGVRSTVTFDRL